MSDAVQIAVIVATGPLLLGAFTSYLGYLNHKKLEVVHKEFNGMKDQLIATTKREAHAAGMKEEKDKISKNRLRP